MTSAFADHKNVTGAGNWNVTNVWRPTWVKMMVMVRRIIAESVRQNSNLAWEDANCLGFMVVILPRGTSVEHRIDCVL